MKRVLNLIVIAVIAFSFVSCSDKTRKSESVLDSPDMHISRGMKYFDSEDYENAKKEFDDAIKIKWNEKDKAGAYAGLGMYYAVKGDKDKAIDNAKEAVSLDNKMPLVYTSYGRTLSYLRSDDEWIEDSFEKFDKAIKLADDIRSTKDLATAYYYKGIAAKTGYKFSDAKDAFSKVVELKSLYATEANKEWEKVQMIERAKPGTKVGAKVALLDKVGRAEIAVLFVEEMKINEILAKKEKKTYDTGYKAPVDPMKLETVKIEKLANATDVENHWAKAWIKDVLEKGFMEAGPDHTFNPNKPITRAEYAVMLLRVLVIISSDESLYTKHFGEESSMFPDVRTDHYAYNAMAVCATRGIMKAELNGEFGIEKEISGAEALLIIRDFQNALTITF